MAITQSQFQSWLDSDSPIRCTLVELVANINGVETPVYLSSKAFNCIASDTAADGSSRANIAYWPLLTNSIEFSETLPVDGTANISYGDIAVDNTNGINDAWMGYAWVNRPISIYIGDQRWQRSDFTNIFSGLVSDINFGDRNTINFSIRSILEKLNTPITAKKISDLSAIVAPNASTLQNKDQLVPLLFGECFNISPISIDPVTYKYMVHDGPIERIIEVRDNGVPLTENVGYTVDATKGTFSLLRAPSGTITCSVQGEQNTVDATGSITTGIWASTVSKIVQLIILKYGNSSLRVLPSEMDLTALDTFNSGASMPVGIYITSNTNVISVCQELAASVGGQFTATRAGLITLLRLTIPNAASNALLLDDQGIIKDTCSISNKLPVRGVINLGYVRNWTVQTTLLTGLPEAHKVAMGTEYLYAIASDVTTITTYKLASTVDPKPTLMLNSTAANVEANRLLTLWKTPRYTFRMNCTPKYLTIALGDMIQVNHYRFGLSVTKPAQVIAIQTNWNTGSVTLEVLV